MFLSQWVVATNPNPTDIALECLLVMKSAKMNIVQTDGIGTDLRPTIFSFRDGRCHAYAQLKNAHNAIEQHARTSGAANLMRAGWGSNAFVLATENYVASPSDQDGYMSIPLAARFANGDQDVIETITLLAVTPKGTTILAQPYTYLVGRKLEWATPLILENAPNTHPHPEMLHDALSQPAQPRTPVNDRATIEMIAELGFIVKTID